MPTFREAFPRLVSALDDRFGRPRRSVEDRSLVETLIAVYWERVVSAKQADAALRVFEESGLSDPSAAGEIEPTTLRDFFLAAGLAVSPKALSPLARLIRWLMTDHMELVDEPHDENRGATSTLREELVAIPGIGQATADDLLLRAFGRARYPLDRATYRILLRHGWIDSTADYDEAAELLIRNSGADPNLLADLSLWFEDLGRSNCRSGGPKCERCPLQPLLPDDGPLGGEP